VAQGRRGLDEVLHHFIPEDEQREARERKLVKLDDKALAIAPPGHRWCLPVEPDRALECATALELAAALAREAGRARIRASFPPPTSLPRAPGVHWETLADLSPALDDLGSGEPMLILAPPEALAALVRGNAARIDGLLLLVDGTPRGVQRALGWLRAHGEAFAALRIGAILVGVGEAASARLSSQLAGAASHQLGLEIETLGRIERDDASFRALLHGTSVFDLDAGSRAALTLESLGERLGQWRAGSPSP
jgi:hypothetical protein